jgi:peptidyl-prolyl cis-trans isomerase-like 3
MSLTLHTTLGDIKIELACGEAPHLSENFLALAASGYYNESVFHRNIPGFLIQTGDPTGTGKGGDSVFGGHLPDEFHPALKVGGAFLRTSTAFLLVFAFS